MQYVCAGLNKTGTTSLARALTFLGLRVLHYDQERLNHVVDGTDTQPDFRVYDDIDAVLDVPAAFFFEELLDAYPASRCILTVRDEDAWWRSICRHFNERDVTSDPQSFTWQVRSLTYGSATATEFIYRKRYRQHLERVNAVVPPERLLVLDVTQPNAFQTLGNFIGRPVAPGLEFPHANFADPNAERDAAAAALAAATPPGATIALADDGWWWEGLNLTDRRVARVSEFPPSWGSPADAAAAVDIVRMAEKEGLEYFALAVTTFWWLDHYPELQQYLDARAEPVHRDWQFAVYRLPRD